MTLALNWLMSVVTALAAKTIPICNVRSRISPQFEPCARGNHEESDVIKGRGAHLPRQKPQDDQPACQYGTRKPRQLCAPPDRSRAPSASPPPRASPPGCRCVASFCLQRITVNALYPHVDGRKGLFFNRFSFLISGTSKTANNFNNIGRDEIPSTPSFRPLQWRPLRWSTQSPGPGRLGSLFQGAFCLTHLSSAAGLCARCAL